MTLCPMQRKTPNSTLPEVKDKRERKEREEVRLGVGAGGQRVETQWSWLGRWHMLHGEPCAARAPGALSESRSG